MFALISKNPFPQNSFPFICGQQSPRSDYVFAYKINVYCWEYRCIRKKQMRYADTCIALFLHCSQLSRKTIFLWSCSYKIACAPSEDSGQTAKMRCLISVFAGHSLGSHWSKASLGGLRRLWSYIQSCSKSCVPAHIDNRYWNELNTMGLAMWKRVFSAWTAKAQISLRIRAVWSSLRCPLTEIFDIIELSNKSKCPDETLRMRMMNLNLRILRMLEDMFRLVRPIYCSL